MRRDIAEQRLERFREEHGFLPIENVEASQSEASLGDKRWGPLNTAPKAKAKTQAKTQPASSSNEPPPKTQPASSSSEPPPKTPARERIVSTSSVWSEDVSQFQQAPIIAPSRVNIAVLREQLAKAYFNKQITDEEDNTFYEMNNDVKQYKKASKAKQQEILKTLRTLYSKYVYNPSKEQRRADKLEAKRSGKQTRATNVKNN